MKISVQIPEVDYSGFGFGSQRYRNKDLSSPRIEIEVMSLPAEGVPKSFGGLVGEHEMTLSIPKTKFLVNEPIEIKLEVKGKGAVENFDAPTIYEDNNLEQFDTKSEVSELGFQAAKKVFEYTLLARAPLKISQNDLEYSYFDPTSARYVIKKIIIPDLVVDGVASSDSIGGSSNQDLLPKNQETSTDFLNNFLAPNVSKPIQIGLVSPKFSFKSKLIDQNIRIFNYILLIILLIIIMAVVRHYLNNSEGVKSSNQQAILEYKNIRKNGLSYASVYRLLAYLDSRKKMSSGGVSIMEIISDSELSDESKEYFKKILATLEMPTYSTKNRSIVSIKAEIKYFKELMKKI